jgi:hypothetical protein
MRGERAGHSKWFFIHAIIITLIFRAMRIKRNFQCFFALNNCFNVFIYFIEIMDLLVSSTLKDYFYDFQLNTAFWFTQMIENMFHKISGWNKTLILLERKHHRFNWYEIVKDLFILLVRIRHFHGGRRLFWN